VFNAEGISAGADVVLEKPLALSTLLAEIARATADWV
jgi:DNA-binding response OmpR family regulator